MASERAPLVVVTGPTAGLGYWTAEALARSGARVVLAARSSERALRAADGIRAQVPDAELLHAQLDLASLRSVRSAADRLSELGPIHALVNNAGVLGSRKRGETTDGHELMFGTNHLGHFALTAALWPSLAPTGRVVHLGSIAHRFERLDWDDLENRRYRSFRAYCRSKLAVMLTGFELARRLRETGDGRSSIVAHPGFAVDGLSPARSALPDARRLPGFIVRALDPVMQSKQAGAQPAVAAAVSPDARNGDFLGPAGLQELRGAVAPLIARPHAYDRASAERLWRESERLTGVRFELS